MKTRILLLILCIVGGLQLRAADGDSFTATTAEGVEMTFVITSEANLTVKVGDSANPAISVETAGSVSIPTSVEHEAQTYAVTAIGINAFNGCTAVTSVELPSSITVIGNYAFNGCSALESVTIPEGIKTIGQYAFSACKALKEVVLPSSLTTLSNYAFKNCSSLESVSIPASIKKLGTEVFSYCGLTSLTIPEGITSMGYATFGNCKQLKSINLPSTLTNVGQQAFRSNTGLTFVEIPEGVKTLTKQAFTGCSNLTEVILPSTLTSAGAEVFNNCKKLSKVIARMENPFSMPSNMFASTSSSIALHIPDGTKESYIAAGWTTDIFKGGIVYGDDTPTKGYSFTAVNDEGTELTYVVTDVDNWGVSLGNGTANAAVSSISGPLTIPASVQTGEWTYQVVAVAAKALQNNEGITSVELPASLQAIGSQAFDGCKGLTSVFARMQPPFTLGADAFTNISNYCGLHVPEGTTVDYLEAGWTKDIFKGGVVEGDDAMTGGYKFTQANADGVEITYVVVDVDEKTVQVGDDKEKAIPAETAGKVSIPATVTVGDVTYSVITVGSNAFADCTGITEVVLPDNLKTIASGAFQGCTGITELVIPATVTAIEANAFSGCEGLKKVMPRMENPFNLIASAFANIHEKASLHVPEGTKAAYLEAGWTEKVFKGGVVEGDNTLIVGTSFVVPDEHGVDILYVVTDADNKTVKVGDSTNPAINVETSGDITIPELVEYEGQTFAVTAIGANAFSGCAAIQKVQIDAKITAMGNNAFLSCKALSAINFPETLTSIGKAAFKECESLATVDFPASLTTIGNEAFSYSGLTSVVIPEGMTSMNYAVFADCYFMTTVVLPGTLKSVGQQAFRHNLRLTSLTISEGVTSLGKHAFYNCQSLKEVTLPSTLTSCNTNVFYYCVSLTKVIARMEDPFTLPNYMFDECSASLSLHIPDGTYDKYAAAGWVPEIFPGGIVYGDDTPTLNEVFTFTTQEGVEVTAVLTDIEKNTIQVGLGTSGNPAIDQATEGIVTLPDTVEAFGQKYVITTIGGYAFRYCNEVTEVRMPATVTHIGRYGFGNMDKLEKAVLPDSLKAMETAAFYKDEALKELTLNEGLEDIGNYAFSYAAIRELEIPTTVTNIGRNSFAACSELDKVISRIGTAYAFQDGAFTGISGTCGLHIPDGTKEAYIEQGWTEEIFPGGIVYGDETLHKGQTFDTTEEDGTKKTFKVTDVNEMTAEMVSVKAGKDAGGTVTLMPTATHELTGNVYTISSIADKAFGADVKKVLSRIETPFAVSSAAFASLPPMCSLHVPAGTKAAYLEQGWTEESFKAGVVEGDDTLVKGETFTLTDEEGTTTTYRVTDVNDNLVEIVSAKEGEEADGRVSIQQAVTDPVAGNDYTVGSIGNGAFKEELKAVTAEAETPYPVAPEAFKGIGDKCVLFVPAGTKDAYIENGWTEDIFKGGIYEGNIPGDVNEDLAVDISDIVAVINQIAGTASYRYADVNGDEKVDISDIVKIINIIAEK